MVSSLIRQLAVLKNSLGLKTNSNIIEIGSTGYSNIINTGVFVQSNDYETLVLQYASRLIGDFLDKPINFVPIEDNTKDRVDNYIDNLIQLGIPLIYEVKLKKKITYKIGLGSNLVWSPELVKNYYLEKAKSKKRRRRIQKLS